MAYSPTDFYGSLRVNPDNSDTIYRGYADMGAGLASGINSLTNAFVDSKRDDKRMAHAEGMMDKQIAAGADARRDSQAFEQLMFGKREASDASRRKQEKADKEAETARFGDNMLSAAFNFAQGVTPGLVNEETFAFFKGLQDGQTKAKMGEQIINMAADKLRQVQEQEAAIAKAKGARETHVLTDPVSGKPDENFYMTGNGVTLPRQTQKPSLTAEQLQSLGMVPDTATVGGVKFKVPEAKGSAPSKIEVELSDGRKVQMTPSEAARLGFIETPSNASTTATPTPSAGFKSSF